MEVKEDHGARSVASARKQNYERYDSQTENTIFMTAYGNHSQSTPSVGCSVLNREESPMNEQNDVPTAYRPAPAPLPESQATEAHVNRPAAVSRLVYRGRGTVIIAGICFRRVYVFSPEEPEQLVEAADVGALVSTGLFWVRR